MKHQFILLAALSLSFSLFSQVSKPGKPAFQVTYKENGKNVNDFWQYNATVKFSLSNWSAQHDYEAYDLKKTKKRIDFDIATFLKLNPGQKVCFYPSEVDESGSGTDGNYTRILTDDGVETIKESDGMGSRTKIITDADYRKEHNIPLNEVYNLNARYYQLDELAELERTATGAILRAYTAVGDNLSEWAVGDEVMQQVFPQVVIFVLTDDDIRNWKNISRSNSRSGSANDESLSVNLSVKMN